ncbi:MAG: MBOAT family protein [Chloroflexi bacterium]|nr:MBOAT family protein [Chloroflexota bacterium]
MGGMDGRSLFRIQIFCDFAGYSDIAIGLARLFGFRLLENFNNPYTAGSLQDFWRRWHISLSTWFRDYVYVPLGGNRTGQWRASANLFVVFVISGIWHGANWTFLLWGAMHGLALLLERRLKNFWRSRQQPKMPAALATTLVLIFVVFAWVPFRAPSIADTFQYWQQMISGSLRPQIPLFLDGLPWLLLYIGTQTIMFLRERNPGLSRILSPKLEMWVFFALIVLIPVQTADFIYFDF